MSERGHIRNPFEVALEQFSAVMPDADTRLARRERHANPGVAVRRLSPDDLWNSLREGAQDLGAVRADVLFVGVIYPLAGLLLARFLLSQNLLPLAFPLVAGFALIGPVAATGLYEISRRREAGEAVSWLSALHVLRSPALPSILLLGLSMLVLFSLWMASAWGIYLVTVGRQFETPIGAAAPSLAAFAHAVAFTPAGWAMIVTGLVVGFPFAVLAMAVSVFSIPLLLDRDVGVPAAVAASLRAVAANPAVMSLWGVVVAALLVVGSIPILFGLIFVVPILGHATWRLYRRAMAPSA